MSVSREEVKRLAGLARLRLSDEDADRLTHDLVGVLEQVGAMEWAGLGTPGGPRASDPGSTDLSPFGRPPDPDTLRRPPSELAPRWRDGFLLVPRLRALDGKEGEGRGA